MARILIHVEGETEESFVNELLGPHLANFGQAASARIMGNARMRSRRGGIRGWPGLRSDLVRRLQSEPDCYATTMVDYYGLPKSGSGEWPGRNEAGKCEFADKASLIQDALIEDIREAIGDQQISQRFIPFVMMHEFEGLLFSDCEAFALGIGRPSLAEDLQAIRDQFDSPEEINDSASTAPSKRIVRLIPNYQKPLMGTLAALEMGLNVIRSECPLFGEWVATLEALT